MTRNQNAYSYQRYRVRNDHKRSKDPFQSNTLAAGSDCEERPLGLSYPAKERQCKTPHAGHDDSEGHHQWLSLSSYARARRSTRPLAQGEQEDAQSRIRGRRRCRDVRDHVSWRETRTRVPADLRKVLAAAPKAQALWSDITPIARRDWIHWITSAKLPETRARRIDNACWMLAAGKRRVCCFDRSGFYSKSFGSPKAAD